MNVRVKLWAATLGRARVVVVVALAAIAVLGADLRHARAADIDIWLDAGHGGRDSGAPGFDQVSAYPEKVAAVEVATKVFDLLGTAGFARFMTRYGDSYPTLSQRVGMANGLEQNEAAEIGTCQAFVSIHMNANESPGPFGTEVFYSRYRAGPKLADAYLSDQAFADVVYSRLIQNTPGAFIGCNDDRGVSTKRHFVTKWPFVPSILVEVCFISNQCQQNQIRQGGKQALVASGIASGISLYVFPGGEPSVAGTDATPIITAAADPPVPWEHRGERPPSMGAARVQAYGESFDDPTFPPPNWTVTSAGQPAPHFWSRSTDSTFVHSGAGAAVVRGASANAVDEWLISPILFLGSTDRGLRFSWLGNRTWATNVGAECLLRPRGTSSWTQLWALSGEYPGQEFTYPQRTVDLTAWMGDSLQFAFRVHGTNGADFAVDDVVIGDFAPEPIAPTNETCASAMALPASQFVITGSTCMAANDLNPHTGNPLACAPDEFSGGDVFYQFVAQVGDTLDVNIAGDWQAVAYVVSACDTAAASCVAASPILEFTDTTSVANLNHVFASGGTYYLVVDGLGGECGSFRMSGFLRGELTDVGDGPTWGPYAGLSVSPNPSRSGVTLSGSLRETSPGSGVLSLFDAAGRRVWRSPITVNGGRFALAWDRRSSSGTRVPAGVYRARVEVGGQVVTGSLILLE